MVTNTVHPEQSSNEKPSEEINYQPTSMIDDIRHNLQNLWIGVSMAAMMLVAFKGLMICIEHLQVLYPQEAYSIPYNANNALYGITYLGIIRFHILLDHKTNLYVGWLFLYFVVRAIFIAVFMVVGNRDLQYFAVLFDFLFSGTGLSFVFVATFRESTIPLCKVVAGAYGVTLQLVQTGVLSAAYFGLSFSKVLTSSFSQLVVFGAVYPLLSTVNVRLVVLNTAQVIIELSGHRVSKEFETFYYICVKLALSIPVYYVLVSIEDHMTFILSAISNVCVELFVAWTECLYGEMISSKVVASFRKQLGATGKSLTPNCNLNRKKTFSRMIMYEEFVESISALLAFTVHYSGNKMALDVAIARTVGLYLLVLIGDLAQKRIFNLYGYYLSRYPLDIQWHELFLIVIPGVSILCYIPVGYAMF